MTAEIKDFKTITLRGLDQKTELVSIMNDVMKKEGLKTGQSVIEFIIADHAKTTHELTVLSQKRKQEKEQYYQWSNRKEDEIEGLKKVLKSLKTAFTNLTEIELQLTNRRIRGTKSNRSNAKQIPLLGFRP